MPEPGGFALRRLDTRLQAQRAQGIQAGGERRGLGRLPVQAHVVLFSTPIQKSQEAMIEHIEEVRRGMVAAGGALQNHLGKWKRERPLGAGQRHHGRGQGVGFATLAAGSNAADVTGLKTERHHRTETNGFGFSGTPAYRSQMWRRPLQQADGLKKIEALRPVDQSLN
jgi:hypothetical protein